jgi:predicted amidohydrolase
VWNKLRDQFVADVDGLAMGDPTDLSNFMGAVIDDRAFAKHKAAIARAKRTDHLTIAAGGTLSDKVGWFVRPTVVVSKRPTDQMFATEYFGPLLAVHVYDDADYERVLGLVDRGAPYGLTGSVIATDRAAIAAAAEAGELMRAPEWSPLGGGAPRAGIFICLESAYPHITRRFAEEGADVLIEITNDAYQGDTAVMRQHLSNAVFRAVETGRTLLRVTNTGISARITPRGEVTGETGRFQEAVRTWTVGRSGGGQTFYVMFGDSFAAACSFVSLFAVALSLRRGKRVRP